ncbi:hypothetical protein KL86DYS1_12210 [uncultured Dysgonomonas sp.]|uniref:Uncharacterized protein n=1 Tax=uncultured Dysgonomonas sp. TaxID=206096 RepID=A0A212JGP0_9BACT|nr:hypothetical protein KL86DYS1_12210 [uncultured Dysgonomonas sp.]
MEMAIKAERERDYVNILSPYHTERSEVSFLRGYFTPLNIIQISLSFIITFVLYNLILKNKYYEKDLINCVLTILFCNKHISTRPDYRR